MTDKQIIVPPIKSQGIKTKLVPWIKSIKPNNVTGLWIEPFMGSGVVAFNIKPQKAILADSNPILIKFYQELSEGRITSRITRMFLKGEGEKLLTSNGDYYYEVRERFNKEGNPLDFLFLNRSCFNGMIRFNRKGGFNVPFCKKPKRFSKAYITKICNQIQLVSDICKIGHYEFICQDFSDTIKMASQNDIIYCDPPYIARHTDYYNGWNEENELQLAKLLTLSKAKFILSTWHSNKYRSNEFIKKYWGDYNILTREHYYHIGGSEANRNSMLEALITNFIVAPHEKKSSNASQLPLFEAVAK